MFLHTTTIVLPYSSPDLDGIACAVAYSELLNKNNISAQPWFLGQPDAEAVYVLSQCENIEFADLEKVKGATEYVLVDGSELEGLPNEVDLEKVIEVIDHRLHHKAIELFPNAKLHIEPVGAAATLIAERFREQNTSPSFASGILLYGAIHSNTQCLQGSVTSKRDIDISNWLKTIVPIPNNLLDNQFAARRNEIIVDLPSAILRESKKFEHSSGSYIVAQLEFKGAGQLIEDSMNIMSDCIIQLGSRTMLNLVDILQGNSYLIVPDPSLRFTVASCTSLKFKGIVAMSNPIFLRKQILAAMEGIPWKSS